MERGAAERAGETADWQRIGSGLAADWRRNVREEMATDDKLRNRHNGALAAAEEL